MKFKCSFSSKSVSAVFSLLGDFCSGSFDYFSAMARPLCSPVGMNFWFQLTKFVLLKLISPIFGLAGTRIVTSGRLFAEAYKQLATDVSCCSSHPLFEHVATLLLDSVSVSWFKSLGNVWNSSVTGLPAAVWSLTERQLMQVRPPPFNNVGQTQHSVLAGCSKMLRFSKYCWD